MKPLLALALLLSALAAPLTDSYYPLRIVSMSLEEYRHFQSVSGPLDRLYIRDGLGYFLTDISPGFVAAMDGHSFSTLPKPPSDAVPLSASGSWGDINGAFHDTFETEAVLRDLAARHPDHADFLTIGQSVEGRAINALRLGTGPDSGTKPRIYMTGCHHAREWISVEVPLDFARFILDSYSTDPRARHCLDEAQIYIIPIMNPDGLEYSITRYRYWRKNRQYNGRYSYGVDLNRNYSYQWGLDNKGSSPSTNSATYRGHAPFSEPETAALRDFMLQNPPAGLISYHNFSQIILYPWGHTREPCSRADEMRELAGRMSARMEKIQGRVYDYGSAGEALYLTNGDTIDWVYGTFSAIAFTIELPPPSTIGHFVTDEADIESICLENREGLLSFIDYFTMGETVRAGISAKQ